MTLHQETRPEPTAAEIAYRNLTLTYKEQIKNDATSLHNWKREIRDYQKANGSGSAAGQQSQCAIAWVKARATHLIYGSLRGRTRDQMEPKHAEHTSNLRYWIAKIWNQYPDSLVPMPEALKVIE